MIVFDGHNDTLTRLHRFEGDPRAFIDGTESGQIDLPRAREGGFGGGLFAIFTDAPEGSPERDPLYGTEFTPEGYITSERSPIAQVDAEAFTDEIIDFAYQLEAECGGQVQIVSRYSSILRCLDHGVLAMVLHLEGAEAIRDDLSNLYRFYERGVRSIGPVWSRPNVFGYGVPFRFPGSPDTGPGLTAAGKALISACNDLGILIDLAHLNAQGFRDVVDLSRAPLVVSHADVHAISPSTRNLTDAQIDAVAASGGIIGINFEVMSTHPQSSIETDVPLRQITQHIDYIVRRVGVDFVGFGSDFDGAGMPDDLRDVSRLPNLLRELETLGYGDAALEKIAYGNWLRVLRETWRD